MVGGVGKDKIILFNFFFKCLGFFILGKISLLGLFFYFIFIALLLASFVVELIFWGFYILF